MKFGILFLLLIFIVVPVCAEYIPDDFTGVEPLTVSFRDMSINNPTMWKWTFKDVIGNNTEITFSRLQNPTYMFNKGNYSIRLYAGNTDGSNVTPSMLAFLNVTSLVKVTVIPTPTHTPTPVITPTHTPTPVITPTHTPTPVITPTHTPTSVRSSSGSSYTIKSVSDTLNLVNITPNSSSNTTINVTTIPTSVITQMPTSVITQIPVSIITPNITLVKVIDDHVKNKSFKNSSLVDGATMSFSGLISSDTVSSTIIPLILIIGVLIGGVIFMRKFGSEEE